MKKLDLVYAFNTLYKDVVNNSNFESNTKDPGYVEAKDYIQKYYENLNTNVLEFLAVFMIKHPGGKVHFMSSKNGVGILCDYDNIQRAVCFNENGVMISDQKRENSEPEK